ncbi:MAG: 4Fe-4S binding protein [Spirochaetes bacterium]|nr:4Fe-4S binding protein [Spirochaetota bacterium]
MAVKIFFSLCMSAVVYFFIVAGKSSPAEWIYAGFLMVLFVQMIRTGDFSKYRRIFQFTFAFLFAISFIGILYDERGSMAIAEDSIQNSEIPFCHITIPLTMLPYFITKTVIFPARIIGHFASVISMLLIWFIVTITIGRGWCSWVCFYGGWEDGVSRLSKKTRFRLLSYNKDIRAFQFAFLFFIILVSFAFLSSVYCEWFCPFKIVTEFSQITDIPGLIATVMFIGLFLGLVIVMPFLTRKRFQCVSFCPFGAFQSFADRLSSFRISIDTDKCSGCMKCASSCPFCAIDKDTITGKKGRPEITCAKCGECIAVCPEKAISYQFSFVRKGCSGPEAESKTGEIIQMFLEPGTLFLFSAFTFSVIISSKFGPDALMRIFSIFTGGL